MCQIRADFTGIKRRIFIPYLYYVYARSPMRIMRAGQYARTRMRERHVSNMLNNIMAQKNVRFLCAIFRFLKIRCKGTNNNLIIQIFSAEK